MLVEEYLLIFEVIGFFGVVFVDDFGIVIVQVGFVVFCDDVILVLIGVQFEVFGYMLSLVVIDCYCVLLCDVLWDGEVVEVIVFVLVCILFEVGKIFGYVGMIQVVFFGVGDCEIIVFIVGNKMVMLLLIKGNFLLVCWLFFEQIDYYVVVNIVDLVEVV